MLYIVLLFNIFFSFHSFHSFHHFQNTYSVVRHEKLLTKSLPHHIQFIRSSSSSSRWSLSILCDGSQPKPFQIFIEEEKRLLSEEERFKSPLPSFHNSGSTAEDERENGMSMTGLCSAGDEDEEDDNDCDNALLAQAMKRLNKEKKDDGKKGDEQENDEDDKAFYAQEDKYSNTDYLLSETVTNDNLTCYYFPLDSAKLESSHLASFGRFKFLSLGSFNEQSIEVTCKDGDDGISYVLTFVDDPISPIQISKASPFPALRFVFKKIDLILI